jgi:hypothetical protein
MNQLCFEGSKKLEGLAKGDVMQEGNKADRYF